MRVRPSFEGIWDKFSNILLLCERLMYWNLILYRQILLTSAIYRSNTAWSPFQKRLRVNKLKNVNMIDLFKIKIEKKIYIIYVLLFRKKNLKRLKKGFISFIVRHFYSFFFFFGAVNKKRTSCLPLKLQSITKKSVSIKAIKVDIDSKFKIFLSFSRLFD